MGDIDCGDCDCGDCDCGDCDCGNCDCGKCWDDCFSDCCDCKDCKGCCNLFSAFTCASCCNDCLEFVCCEGPCDFGTSTNRGYQPSGAMTGQQCQQQQQRQCQQQFQEPPLLQQPVGYGDPLEPDLHPSAPPPSYAEAVLNQPLPNGVEPAITSQPGYDAQLPSTVI